MPRYFFDLQDGQREPDDIGLELADDDAARIAAIRFAGDCARDDPSLLDATGRLTVILIDEKRSALCHVEVRIMAPPPDDRVMPAVPPG